MEHTQIQTGHKGADILFNLLTAVLFAGSFMTIPNTPETWLYVFKFTLVAFAFYVQTLKWRKYRKK